jgi:hypothetical protein
MANWCNNSVYFSGTPANLEQVSRLFNNIHEKHWLPPFVTEIQVHHENVSYRSRWIPNNEALVQIATQYALDFVNCYDEPVTGLFGETNFSNGVLSNIRLDGDDLKSSLYDPETNRFTYKGQNYPDEWPILVQLLEQKKFNSLYLKTTNNITKQELIQRYGELGDPDLVLKFAEHKNFDQAREVFDHMDEKTILAVANFLTNTHQYRPGLFATRDKFLAFHFLEQLVSDWNQRQQAIGFSR